MNARITRLAAAALLAAASTSWAQDFQVGSRAKGMGGSYTAFEDDPVSIWLNPAGIARQETRAAVQYQTFTQYELEREGQFVGTQGKAESGLTDPPAIPAFAGLIVPFSGKTDHAFAIALVRPFENRLTYDFPAPPAVVAQTDQQFWRFRFAYALDFKLSKESNWFPHLSLGAAVDVGYTRYAFRSYSSSGVVIDDIADTNTRVGWGAGALTSVYDDRDWLRFDVGVAYQSAINFDLQQDEATFASWDWPAMFNGGFTLYLFSQRVKLTADVQWIGWDHATADSEDPLSPSFEDSLNYSAGLEVELELAKEIWLLPRVGYRLYDAPWDDPNNLPSIALTKLNIVTEDEKFNLFTFGFGIRWKTEQGRFRGFDAGVELGADVTNYSLGIIYDF
jgi:hypothetical protein